jgi:hypothetical protein
VPLRPEEIADAEKMHPFVCDYKCCRFPASCISIFIGSLALLIPIFFFDGQTRPWAHFAPAW